MATKGGSLLGKADSTLAQMSYREAMADVAPDLKSVYQEEMLTQAMFEKGVQDHFDTLYADNNALSKELEDATAKAMTGLGTDYQGMELFNNELNSMKERAKALPKTKKGNFERAKIRAEMSELLKSSADLDATITKIGTMIDNKEYNKNATGSKNLSLLTSIANGTAKKNIKNGKLFYSMDYNGETVEMDRDAVESALVQNDPKFQASFEKISPTYNNKGKQKGTKWEDSRQAAINDYADSFTSEAAYAANINERQGGLGYTFVEALMGKDGSDSIYKALMNMGPATIKKYDVAGGADGKSDGKITEADFANPENGITLIKSLTDIHDKENFDFETAKLVAGEFYADKIAKKEFDDGMKMRTSETPKYLIPGTAEWKRVRDVTTPETRTIEFDFFSGAEDESGNPTSKKQKTTSTELINLDDQLGDLMKQDSFATDNYADIFGNRIGYFPNKGFAPVRLATQEDVDSDKFTNALGRKLKVGEIIRITPGSDIAYWKTPKDVFKNYSIPTTYNKKRYYEGQTATHKNGRPIIFKGRKWVYND